MQPCCCSDPGCAFGSSLAKDKTCALSLFSLSLSLSFFAFVSFIASFLARSSTQVHQKMTATWRLFVGTVVYTLESLCVLECVVPVNPCSKSSTKTPEYSYSGPRHAYALTHQCVYEYNHIMYIVFMCVCNIDRGDKMKQYIVDTYTVTYT